MGGFLEILRQHDGHNGQYFITGQDKPFLLLEENGTGQHSLWTVA